MYATTRPSVRVLVAGLLALLCAVLLMVLCSHSVAGQLHRWKLLPEPERLTELYFSRHNQLPATYVPGQPVVVPFTIHNLEGRDMTYHYTVTQQSPGVQAVVLTSGSLQLRNNQSHTQANTVLPVDMERSNLRVTLQPGNEAINVWMDKRG